MSYRMRLLTQLMARKFQDVLDPFGLTPLHWGVLSCLWQEDGLATLELASRLEQLPGTIIAGLGAMQKRGLVKRTADSSDRRISRIWLTRRGQSLRESLVPPVESLIGNMFIVLSEKECSQLSLAVDRLRVHIERL
jgi:DNA-binding MarR family transcriptional regulator